MRGAQQQHVAGVRLRGVRFAVGGVPVVPDRDQPQVTHRREHGRAGADRRVDGASADGEPLPVALLRSGFGGEQRVPPLPQQRGQRRVHTGGGPSVGDDDQGPAPGGEGRGDGAGDLVRPGGAGQRVPDGAGRIPAGEGLQEGRSVRVPLPRAGGGCGRRRQRPGGRLGLGAGAARRHGELEHVGEAPGVPVGHRAGEPQRARGRGRARVTRRRRARRGARGSRCPRAARRGTRR